MNVLALDGALGAFSAAVARDGRIVASASEPGGRALERGLALLAATLRDADLPADRIDRLAVGIGPGSFTGLRIAVAYAKALAAAWRLPLVAVSSFDLLEYGADVDGNLTVVVGRPGVISARLRDGARLRRASGRIGEVLDALLPAAAGELTTVGAPEDVLHALAERRWQVLSLVPAVTPAAAAAALAAAARLPASSPHAVTADYGELPAARALQR